MEKNGILTKVYKADGAALYTLNKNIHNHILECQKCHKKIKLDVCPYQFFQENYLNNKGFIIIDDTTKIRGYCTTCLEQ